MTCCSREGSITECAGQLWQTVLTFRLNATSVQSKVEKRPPHTAKLPPSLGASRLMACSRKQCIHRDAHAGTQLMGWSSTAWLPGRIKALDVSARTDGTQPR